MNAPAIAQTVGPGGVANPDLWLESDDAGNIATAWQDNSANNNPVEAVGSWSLSPADRAHNFHPHTTGYTTTRYFRDASSFMPAGIRLESVSIFSAVRRTSANQGRIIGVDDDPTYADEPGFSITTQGFPRFYKYSGGIDSQNFSTAMTLNRSGIAYFISDDPGGTIEIGLDGQSQSRTRSGRQYTVGRSLLVGYGSWGLNTPGAFPGDIMEVIWFRRALSAAERDRINAYLAIKHGTTLASSYLSSSGATIWNFADASGFNQNIAGIGLDQASGLHQKQANSINGGDQVIVALGNNVAASNAGNTGAFTVDRSFLMWGDNAGGTSYSTPTTIGAATYNRMARTWRVQQTGTVPQATIAYPHSGTDNVHLIISNTADFSGTNTVVAMPTTQVIEGVAYRTTAAPISFGANTFFTFATSVPDPLVVTNTNDTGAGSLRNAITFANSQPTASTITFAIPGAGPHTITLSSVLPNLTATGLTIDGTTQPGTQCRDLWVGNGHDLRINVRGSSGFDGFRLGGTNQTVRGLSITGFANGIRTLPGSNGTTVECNYLGLLASGASSGNSRGVVLEGASGRIGGLDAGQGNVISANSTVGVVTFAGSADTAIRNNFIGTDAAGMAARANGTGINNFNGTVTWRDITRNLIAGNNGNAGIALETDDRVSPSDGQIRIQSNIIGTNRTMTALLRNSGDGIYFDANSITGALIGGTGSDEGNIITANDDGIDLRSVSNITIRGNTVAISGQRGIHLNNVNTVEIGGASAGQGNSIGGNGNDAIYATNSSTNLTILGNLIQPIATIGGTFANGGHGIWLDRTSNVTIGNGTAAGRNVIGGNRRRGIQGSDTNSTVAINGNYIGTDATGNVAVANGQNEGTASRDAISFQGGSHANVAVLNNVIGGYSAALVEFWDTTVNGVTIQGNNLGVGANGTSQIISANTDDLIYMGGFTRNYSNVLIGGSGAGQGNTMAYSNRSGVRIESSGTNIQVIGNTIRNNTRNGIYVINTAGASLLGNQIYANGLLGIDLGDNGVTTNDGGDGDSGPNNLLNYPVISALWTGTDGSLAYNLTLDVPAETNGYRIDFYRNPTPDPSTFGEGEQWLGFIETAAHPGGSVAYSGTFTPLVAVNAGDNVAATTTRKTGAASYGETSEFNPNAAVAVSPLIVTTNSDSGTGSLRNAITFANSQASASTISFAIPGAGPHTIMLASVLPAITANNVTIDGTTQPGTQCRDLWVGNGHDLLINVTGTAAIDGFRLRGANQTIRGLAISGLARGIGLSTSSIGATIQCSYIGLRADGSSNGNANQGIENFGASARIGGLGPGEGNVISANGSGVITNSNSTDTAIRGNFIGTDPAGMAARPNGVAINHLNASGTWRDITYNLISGNTSGGIVLESADRITPSDGQVRIQRNIIGFNRMLSALLANAGDGIFFDNGSITNVLIGGDAATEGNQIAGGNDAIDLRAVTNIIIRGNTLARSPARGIWIAGASNITLGGTAAGEGNTIGGNGADGIFIGGDASNITVLGNLIQPITIAGATASANASHGIWIERANTVNIGDGTAAGRNVIGGNRGRGIQGSVANSNVTINGNYIGTDASGNVAVVGGQSLPASRKDAISFDDTGSYTSLAILNNVIGGYEGALIELWNSTANGVTIQGNAIGVGANGTSQIVPVNTEDLIYIGGGGIYSNVLIGGTTAGQGNTIAFSTRSGIRLATGGSNLQVIGNTIRSNTRNGIYLAGDTRAAIISNRIFSNGLLGIDLGDNSVTANDAGDGDSGANDLLNFPQAVRAIVNGPNALGYNFTLDAPAAGDGYRIEFFANTTANPSGFGEGERYLGHVDITHAGGVQTYAGTLTTLEPVSIGDVISATTTRRTASGSWDITSEFSAVVAADGVAALTVAMATELFDPPAGQAFFIPGNDVLVSVTISNGGNGSTDPDSVFVAIAIDPANAVFNDVTPLLGGVVGFESGAPSLTFNPATDLRFSNAAAAPASFAACTYTPATGYDPQVRHVCLNPKGSLPTGLPQGQFTVRLRARIK